MIKKITCGITLILCCSCSTQIAQTNTFLEQRSVIADSLENSQRLADALIQWKILHATYPNNELVNGHISRLEFLISDRVIEQLTILDQAKSDGNQELERTVYLKILALDPNNQIAIQELRNFEWQFAIEEASSKTATIQKYFVETQEKAKISIQLKQYIEQGEQFKHDKKYNRLLQLADKFEDSYPTHAKPTEYRIFAFTKLGDAQQKQNKPDKAIEYYQQAIDLAERKGQKLTNVRKKAKDLRDSLANNFFQLANQVFKTDLDEAIRYFELTIKYQPNNKKAQQLMLRAIKIRHNLMKIKKLDANSD